MNIDDSLDSMSLVDSEEEGLDNLEITHNGKIYHTPPAVDMCETTIIGPEDSENALCSHGFASCVASALIGRNNEFLSLSHNAINTSSSLEVISFIEKQKKEFEEKYRQERREYDAKNCDFDLIVGMSWHDLFIGKCQETKQKFLDYLDAIKPFEGDYNQLNQVEQYYKTKVEELVDFTEEQKNQVTSFFVASIQVMQDVQRELGIKITNLPKSTILVSKSGEVFTDIDQELMYGSLYGSVVDFHFLNESPNQQNVEIKDCASLVGNSLARQER